MELRIYLSELATIAALAKVAKQTEIYNQAKEAYDHLVSQYNEQARPKKKGFWEQFKDNLTFRDLDINSTELLQSLEEVLHIICLLELTQIVPYTKQIKL